MSNIKIIHEIFLVFLLWLNAHSIKLTSWTVFKCTTQWQVYLQHCVISTTTISRTPSSFQTETTLYIHSLPPLPVTSILLSDSMSLPTLGTSYKWNHTVFILLCLAYCTEHNLVKVHACCSLDPCFIPFHSRITLRCLCRPQFVSPFIRWWTLGLFPFGCCG